MGVSEGNIISGTFRLAFDGVSTKDIPYDASPLEMREALESLPAIETVEVEKTAADDQRGYTWSITYTGAMNDGDVQPLQPDNTGLDVSNREAAPDGVEVIVREVRNGNEVGGSFKL